MSIYTECSKTARELERQREPFTDLDIIDRARRPDWTELDEKQAQHDAAQIAAAFFRAGRLVRFGPVEYGPEADYARGIEGRLLYAAALHEARRLSTPNGEFEEIFYEDDPLSKNGRRKGSTRNDLEPWSAQEPVAKIESEPSDIEELQREVERLRQDRAQAHERIDALEEEIERLRQHGAAREASEKIPA